MKTEFVVTRKLLEIWANDLALHGVGDIETAKHIDQMLKETPGCDHFYANDDPPNYEIRCTKFGGRR